MSKNCCDKNQKSKIALKSVEIFKQTEFLPKSAPISSTFPEYYPCCLIAQTSSMKDVTKTLAISDTFNS